MGDIKIIKKRALEDQFRFLQQHLRVNLLFITLFKTICLFLDFLSSYGRMRYSFIHHL